MYLGRVVLHLGLVLALRWSVDKMMSGASGHAVMLPLSDLSGECEQAWEAWLERVL